MILKLNKMISSTNYAAADWIGGHRCVSQLSQKALQKLFVNKIVNFLKNYSIPFLVH